MGNPSQKNNIEDHIARIRSKQATRYDIEGLYEGILQGDRSALSAAITLVESRRVEDIPLSHFLLKKCLGKGRALRIGITGTPGVGKSTFINTYAGLMARRGHKVAILSIDPSSYLSRGSILGDKTRMDDISGLENVYIRPSATGETLGGVHERTREAIILCEAAGYDYIIVETVGVGQSEYYVQRMTDVMVLLLLPGSGDELQGIKKGIVEAADIILINKEDIFTAAMVRQAVSDYTSAIHQARGKDSGWTVRILPCNAADSASVDKANAVIGEFLNNMEVWGNLVKHRERQWNDWFHDSLGWAVNQVFRMEGSAMRSYLPAPDELPPAKAYELVKKLFSKQD